MAEPMRIDIKNAADIRRAFAKSPAKMVRNLNKGIKKSILGIQGDSMKNTPVLTGRLRSSHYTLFEPLRGTVAVDPSDNPEARGVNYAPFVHWGTRYMAARPFMLFAVQANEGRVQKNFVDAVDDTLKEIAKETG